MSAADAEPAAMETADGGAPPTDPPNPPQSTVYVTGLSQKVKIPALKAELMEIFGAHGQVRRAPGPRSSVHAPPRCPSTATPAAPRRPCPLHRPPPAMAATCPVRAPTPRARCWTSSR